MKKTLRGRKIAPPLSPAKQSKFLLVQIAPEKVGMFRFLLEAYGHLAYFSVINKYDALLKVVYSPHMEQATKSALNDISQSIDINILPWPGLSYPQKIQ